MEMDGMGGVAQQGAMNKEPSSSNDGSNDQSPQVRSNFNETWIWQTVRTGYISLFK